MSSDTFCSKPFSSFFYDVDRQIRFCCSMQGSLTSTNVENKIISLHGDLANEIRQAIIDGTWHPACSRCKENEFLLGTSERTQGFPANLKVDASPNNYTMLTADIRWDTVCNLACDYCSSYYSSRWEHHFSDPRTIPIKTHPKQTADNMVFELLRSNKETLSNINLLGGEPLLQRQNVQLINEFQNAAIYILTNLSVDLSSNKVADAAQNHPNCSWGVSFETIGGRFEYVRYGANWNTFVANLKLLSSRIGDHRIGAHPIYCAYNALHLCEFYDFIDSSNLFSENGVIWGVIQEDQQHPRLSLLSFGPKLRVLALDELKKCISLYEHKYDMSSLRRIYSTLRESSNKEEFVERFDTRIPEKLDKFKELFPELVN